METKITLVWKVGDFEFKTKDGANLFCDLIQAANESDDSYISNIEHTIHRLVKAYELFIERKQNETLRASEIENTEA